MRSLSLMLFALVLLAHGPLAAQAADPAARVVAAIRPASFRAHLAFLADDALEGRAPATRGGELAAKYIATQFARLGLEPAGDDGTFFHRIPVVTVAGEPELAVVAPAARTLRAKEDYVLWSMRDEADVVVSAPVVFVGYGITAPEWQWDDFAGIDVAGKFIVVLVNDPGLRTPGIFRGEELTYYGRWTYKLEEAERRGAAGVLLVHETEAATYPWGTVQASWSGPQVRLARPAASPLQVAGWLSLDAATALFAGAGKDLAALSAEAARPGFRARPLDVTLRATVRSTVTRSETANVVARLRGRGPHAGEVVAVGGHYDHLGIGLPVDGDSIYNGAQDNAAGTSGVIALAEAFVASGVRPDRGVLFIAFGAEEAGLIGSTAYAQRPTVPLRDIAALVNLDGINFLGRMLDVGALGRDQSSLGPTFDRAARAQGLGISDDPLQRLRGSFFRSDHFPFVKAGVPALSFESGEHYAGRSDAWVAEQNHLYVTQRYHRPQDQYDPSLVLDGAIQQLQVAARVLLAVGDAPAQPRWASTSEFAAAGAARLSR